MSLFNTEVTVTTEASTIRFFMTHADEIDFGADYQRDYVWGQAEQQALLQTIFNGGSIGFVSVANNERGAPMYKEIVDGKQRVTTLLKFVNNEFPYIDGDQHIFYRDMSDTDQIRFKNVPLPQAILSANNKKPSKVQLLRYFHRVNFAGVPQSAEHKAKVEQMLADAGATA